MYDGLTGVAHSGNQPTRWTAPLSPASRNSTSPFALPPLFVASGFVLAFLACYIWLDSRPGVAWSILTIFAAGTTATRRLRLNGLLDPVGLFAFTFTAYNGVLLLRLATMQDPGSVVYPWPFSPLAYGQTGVLDAVAALTILFTDIFLTRIAPTTGYFSPEAARDTKRSPTAWLHAGLFVYVAGLLMYFEQYSQIGRISRRNQDGAWDRPD